MKSYLVALALGLTLVLVESSLWFAPWLLVFSWLITRTMLLPRAIWLIFALGVILDILLVTPVGISSLVLLGASLIFWAERQAFASLRIDIAFLLLASLAWMQWRGQSWWVVAGLLVALLVGLKLTNPRNEGVSLRQL